MTWRREGQSRLCMRDLKLLHCDIMWGLLSWSVLLMLLATIILLLRGSYLLKITISSRTTMKLRSSLRAAEKAHVVVNFIWYRVGHVRWIAANTCAIIRVRLRVSDICSATRSYILLRYHTFWSLVTLIYLSAHYFCCRSFSYKFLLVELYLRMWGLNRVGKHLGLLSGRSMIAFLVRLYDLVRAGWSHARRPAIITLASPLQQVLRRRCHSTSHLSTLIPAWHLMLWGELLLHLLKVNIVGVAMPSIVVVVVQMRGCCWVATHF